MKIIAAAVAALLFAGPVMAQSTPTIRTYPGQIAGGMNQPTFDANTAPVGFGENNINPAVVAAGTTQATAAIITAKTNVLTSCPSGAGVQLPSLVRYASIILVNRSGAACTVYPSPGATVESVSGTAAAVNAGVTIANNASVTFRPVSAAAWVQ